MRYAKAKARRLSPEKNPPVNNPVIGDETGDKKLFVSSRSMVNYRKFTGGKFVGWISL
ncbi:MAG: hypothetical protein ACYTX0_36660 [Nostoc sp.]